MKSKTEINQVLIGVDEGDSGEDDADKIVIDGVVEVDLDKGTLTFPTPDRIGIQITDNNLSNLPEHVQVDLINFIAKQAAKASRLDN